MTKNMAMLDRLVRAFIVTPLAVLVAYAIGFATVGGVLALVVAVAMLGTAVVGFCPLYALLGLKFGDAKAGT